MSNRGGVHLRFVYLKWKLRYLLCLRRWNGTESPRIHPAIHCCYRLTGHLLSHLFCCSSTPWSYTNRSRSVNNLGIAMRIFNKESVVYKSSSLSLLFNEGIGFREEVMVSYSVYSYVFIHDHAPILSFELASVAPLSSDAGSAPACSALAPTIF